jgi:hypothetical protein
MVSEYELLKALGKVEQRVQKLEDSITGAASFTMDRHALNAVIKDHILWLHFDLERARHLVGQHEQQQAEQQATQQVTQANT